METKVETSKIAKHIANSIFETVRIETRIHTEDGLTANDVIDALAMNIGAILYGTRVVGHLNRLDESTALQDAAGVLLTVGTVLCEGLKDEDAAAELADALQIDDLIPTSYTVHDAPLKDVMLDFTDEELKEPEPEEEVTEPKFYAGVIDLETGEYTEL
jgi:hypothetical protein